MIGDPAPVGRHAWTRFNEVSPDQDLGLGRSVYCRNADVAPGRRIYEQVVVGYSGRNGAFVHDDLRLVRTITMLP